MNATKNYLKTLRSLFPIYGSAEKRFYEDFSSSVLEYALLHPDTDITLLETEFGSPQMVMADYLSNMDTPYLSRQLNRTRHVRTVCLLSILAILVCFIFWNYSNYLAYTEYLNTLPAYYTEEIEYLSEIN